MSLLMLLLNLAFTWYLSSKELENSLVVTLLLGRYIYSPLCSIHSIVPQIFIEHLLCSRLLVWALEIEKRKRETTALFLWNLHYGNGVAGVNNNQHKNVRSWEEDIWDRVSGRGTSTFWKPWCRSMFGILRTIRNTSVAWRKCSWDRKGHEASDSRGRSWIAS